jgi:hypothetical protein
MLETPLKTRLEHTQMMFSEWLLPGSISANREVDLGAEHIYLRRETRVRDIRRTPLDNRRTPPLIVVASP